MLPAFPITRTLHSNKLLAGVKPPLTALVMLVTEGCGHQHNFLSVSANRSD